MKLAPLCLIPLTMLICARADEDEGHAANDIVVIESALGSLKQAKPGDRQWREALTELEQAFSNIKHELAGRRPGEADREQRALPMTADFHHVHRGTAIPSNSRVLQVDREHKQVLLSTGHKDGIRKGQLYRVYQGGKSSPDQAAWIRVTKVAPRWSTAAIVHEYGPRATVQPHDIIQRDNGEEPVNSVGLPSKRRVK